MSRLKSVKKARGFTLIEIMITLALGLLISGAVIQVMVSNSVTDRLNRAIASAQESGRFIVNRLRSDVIETGLYNPMSGALDRSVDIVGEAAFVQNHPIPLPGDFVSRAGLGAQEGANGDSDTLVVSLQAQRDCRGYTLGYPAGAEFYVVNEYFVDGRQLKCRGFDGRFLRGQRAAVGHNGHAAFTLLDDVESFQVLYGVADSAIAGDNSARPVQYINANLLNARLAAGGQVVALRLAVLVRGDGQVSLDPAPTFKLLDADPVTPGNQHIYKQFEVTIALRNVKNFVRSISR
ncbi:PilW family protein [Alteromonas oceanisediminis]|uniref:PilW family protein n=1 Tax=Alteromonas oceanisediminis TaxID=2836180 RepID=UPI001BDA743E|nr:PilW family protein [Alteromonas oceanisediminis]MBT0585783.1 PilW family protein [Alteromonas oceanisediminis]